MKAIIENNNTYEVTSERGDFFICKDSRGKIKMFPKHLVQVVEVESMPKAKVFKHKKSSKETIERDYRQFQSRMREAEFQENYLECQRSIKY